MASKLSGKQLPLGYSISTIGLSALYPKDLNRENAVVFLDTAGTETPVFIIFYLDLLPEWGRGHKRISGRSSDWWDQA